MALKGAAPPQIMLGEMDRSITILRDMLNPSFSNIYVNNLISALLSLIAGICRPPEVGVENRQRETSEPFLPIVINGQGFRYGWRT